MLAPQQQVQSFRTGGNCQAEHFRRILHNTDITTALHTDESDDTPAPNWPVLTTGAQRYNIGKMAVEGVAPSSQLLN